MNNEEGHIWFHADDYGVTPEQSERILDCYKQGVLNSIKRIAQFTGSCGMQEVIGRGRPKTSDQKSASYKSGGGKTGNWGRSGESCW